MAKGDMSKGTGGGVPASARELRAYDRDGCFFGRIEPQGLVLFLLIA